jgi:metal-dependent amidase/aminoacylase/carboxypeptidase family protein
MIDIKTIINEEKATIAAIRQALHKIPEKAFTEKKTSQFIVDYLKTIPELVKNGVRVKLIP